jgi:hypothetical protein
MSQGVSTGQLYQTFFLSVLFPFYGESVPAWNDGISNRADSLGGDFYPGGHYGHSSISHGHYSTGLQSQGYTNHCNQSSDEFVQ